MDSKPPAPEKYPPSSIPTNEVGKPFSVSSNDATGHENAPEGTRPATAPRPLASIEQHRRVVSTMDIDHVFKYHAPSPDQVPKYEELREYAKMFADAIIRLTPACADQSAALRHVREAVMTANASIALGGRL